MPNINIELKGYAAEVIKKMLTDGYAKTKTEQISKFKKDTKLGLNLRLPRIGCCCTTWVSGDTSS